MLSQLIVRNYTLVDQLELEFSSGMTVVTGETGTGKSIMLDALGLALGDRSDIGLIGLNAEKAEVHATFDLMDNPAALAWLEQRELKTDHAECILRRVIGKDGRSRGFINGNPSTINDMKVLGEMLIDIHSQHEHQSLLRKDTQRRLLDESAAAIEIADKVAELFHELQHQQNELDRLLSSNEEQSARLQLLSYQFDELEKLSITPGEHESLEKEQKTLSSAEFILGNCNAAMDLCQRADNSSSTLEQLSKTVQLLEAIDLDGIRPIHALLDSAKIQIEEAILDLERFSSDFQIDPARLLKVEERLSEIYNLCRKHRIKPSGIAQLEHDISVELQSLNNIDDDILISEEKIQALKQAYIDQAGKLSTLRNKAAHKLKKSVSDQLAQLGMAGATFDISLTKYPEDQISAKGMEDVEFLISTNPGQAARALNKIASGGELSRISLAIQVVTADTSDIPTLVFDEVDVGIGGGVAEVVGALLRQLGKKAQIICVTHLAQVAAQGHQHLRVTKTSDGQHTRTEIHHLDPAEKVAEIARMLGGIEMTDQSMAHAEEMYKTAQL